MKINKYQLFEKGIYVENMTNPNKIQDLINKLRPISTEHRLLRFGGENDGGYLLPNDLEGIKVCFSPGVDVTASFEKAILTNGIESHLADFSVNGPPDGFEPKSFLKKFIGPSNDEVYISLEQWIRMTGELNCLGDFLLQMDIEGGEYISILQMPEEILGRFRIIAVEIHNVETWGVRDFFNMLVAPFFEKLLKKYFVVHNHPNNCCGLVNLGGVIAPRVFEITLIRKDRARNLGYRCDFPHALDRPNLLNKPDLALPSNWYGLG